MRTFDIYHHPIRGYAVVTRGFSWLDFVFPGAWLLVRRCWSIGAGMLAANVAIGEIARRADAGGENTTWLLALVLSLAMAAVCGVQGSRWRVRSLVARGYDHRGTVSAASPDAALAALVRGTPTATGMPLGAAA